MRLVTNKNKIKIYFLDIKFIFVKQSGTKVAWCLVTIEYFLQIHITIETIAYMDTIKFEHITAWVQSTHIITPGSQTFISGGS